MAKTLLNAVNEIFKRVSLIAGDSSALTSLTDSARQVDVDVAVQSVNEAIDELYSSSATRRPNQGASSTITLVTSTQAYALASDCVRLHFPLVDSTNSQAIYEYKAGYDALWYLNQISAQTGTPLYGAIRPSDGYIYLDRAPTSTDNGKVYNYNYDKDLVLSLAADTVPFNDEIFRAMVPAWVQVWKRERRNEFDVELFKSSIGRAARLLPKIPQRTSWSPR